MHDTQSNSKPVRFHCRHIFTDGLRCGSFCLRGEEFCYYHHNSRRPVPIQELEHRRLHREEFRLPNLEDRSQTTVTEELLEDLGRDSPDDPPSRPPTSDPLSSTLYALSTA